MRFLFPGSVLVRFICPGVREGELRYPPQTADISVPLLLCAASSPLLLPSFSSLNFCCCFSSFPINLLTINSQGPQGGDSIFNTTTKPTDPFVLLTDVTAPLKSSVKNKTYILKGFLLEHHHRGGSPLELTADFSTGAGSLLVDRSEPVNWIYSIFFSFLLNE